jgi:cell division transport system ATP-binding protein
VGSGKSSLLRTLYAELPLMCGEGEVAGFALDGIKKSRVSRLRRKCSIVFQDFRLLTDRSVYANLAFVLRATGWKPKTIEQRVQEVLEQVEMPEAGEKFPHQLSGGEQQRVVLARALLNSPPVILADEPTGNIDPATSFRLIELLKGFSENGTTILIATHQYDLIERYPGRVFRCDQGRLAEDPAFAWNARGTSPAERKEGAEEIEFELL